MSIDAGRYRYNFEDFYKNFTSRKSTNRKKTTTSKSVHMKLVGNSPLSSFFHSVKSVQKEIQPFSDFLDTNKD